MTRRQKLNFLHGILKGERSITEIIPEEVKFKVSYSDLTKAEYIYAKKKSISTVFVGYEHYEISPPHE